MLTAEILKTQILCTIHATGIQPMYCEAVLMSHGHICKLHARTHARTHSLKVTQ
jgi:hypothetical protein